MPQSDQDWENLKEIFHAAVALAAEERAGYLDRVCDGDASLRQAVESLIKSHEETGFVDEPAYQAAAEMLAGGTEFQSGQTVAHYKILSLLGEGGMGQVYLAEDTKLHRRVAIKFLPADSNANEQANRRLLREARAAAKLDHPNICAVHEVGEENGRSFIVMPYVAGETLDVRMQGKPLELSESLAIATQVADALAEAHEQRIIHRDIKPSNIVITPRGQAKVMDFGLAKDSPTHSAVDAEASTQALVTSPGMIVGTVPYMSPEQLHGQPLDVRTDIFSFGIVFYEMLTGAKPFSAASPAGIISAILTEQPARIDKHVAGCPPELQTIVDKCLEKNRERRYQTMRVIAEDLDKVRQGCSLVATQRRFTEEAKMQPRKIETAASEVRPAVTRRLVTRRLAIGFALLLTIAVVSVYAVFFRKGSNGSNLKSADSAYDLYLRGKLKNNDHNRESNDAAIKLLERAVATDPNFAPAYAELGRAYGTKASDFFVADPERKKLNEDAKWAVEKSLALNPNLADGHLIRGYLLWTHDNGFPHEQAIQSFKRAIALDPNLEQARHWLGVVYFHIGLLDKAQEEIDKALSLDPSDNLARFRLGTINIYRGKYEEALRVLDHIPPDTNPPLIFRSRAHALFELGRTEEASQIVEYYLKTYADEGGNVTSIKAMLFAKAGKESEAEDMIQRATETGKTFVHFHHTAYNIASAYALMNKPEQAIKWLQDAAGDGFPCYPLFENDATLNNLRKDERFIAFMTKQKQHWEQYKSSL